MQAQVETAVLGGGCFWCLEAVFDEVQGVLEVESGYSGGYVPNPSYRQVCAGQTGHAEVVRIRFDPEVISYEDVLSIFFVIHDPTTLNRQGNDVGSQYRSVIFAQTAEQARLAEELKAQVQAELGRSVVTEVRAAEPYFRAEEEHQEYFRYHPEQAYCAMVVAPKVEKFRKVFAGHRKLTQVA